MGKNKTNSKGYRTKLDIAALIISVLAIIVSMITGIVIPVWQQKDEQNLANELRIKEAIPAFRIVHDMEANDVMEIFPPYRKPQLVELGNGVMGREVYYVIKDFSIQNLSSNLAYFSHIEYGNEAFELINLGLVAKENEIITLSNDNKFVGYYPQSRFYIICRSVYDIYYRYECTLNSDQNLGDICTYTVDFIGAAEEYDINNEIYKSMYKHVRDVQLPPNILFMI